MRREEQEEKVAALLGGLGRIEAPAGFEDRVMRRIAEPAPAQGYGRPGLLLGLKFAVPAAALLLMGVLFVFFGDREVDNALVPPVQDGQSGPVKGSDVLQPANVTVASANPASSAQPARSPGANAARSPNAPPLPHPGGGSVDIAVEGPGETITPPGLDPRPRNIDPAAVSQKGGVRIGDVLSFFGVGADCGGDGCRVTSVSKGSLAERAKLSVGDRIVSIDGGTINAATAFSGPTAFKTFQVVRGGRTLNLSLSSN